jgi:Tfp pilus assembly protein FimT
MKTEIRNPKSERGLTLIEALAYIAVLAVIIAIAGKTFGRAWDQSRAIQRNTDDIKRVLHAGERWRRDIRAATGRIEAQTVEGAQGCIIPTAGGQVVWLLSSNVVRRSAAAEQPEFVMVPRAKDCRFAADERGKVTAWRWDVELLPAQKQARVKPLFTFTAVPPQEKNQ